MKCIKVSSVSISVVSSTMLITLYARARESTSRYPVITDPEAVEMIDIVKKEIAGSDNPIHKKILMNSYNPKRAVTMALHSRRFDRYVSDFLSKYPKGTVLNLGHGLDTRFYHIDNGTVIWYDIDFPDVIELRKRFLPENSRHFIFVTGEDNMKIIRDMTAEYIQKTIRLLLRYSSMPLNSLQLHRQIVILLYNWYSFTPNHLVWQHVGMD